jgi:glycosyltransferase involved in cell wall biosynthesis
VQNRSSQESIDRVRAATRSRIGERKTDAMLRARGNTSRTMERIRTAGSEVRTRPTLTPRLQEHAQRSGVHIAARTGDRLYRDHTGRHRSIVYHDRPDLVRHRPRHVHTYRDHHYRRCHRIIWPRYCYPVHYYCGPRPVYRWCYPYYHRKYVFVSIGGYWPIGCSYRRYYWYGWHPYAWYGYYPVPRQVDAGTYNYYTYNYYTTDEGTATTSDVLPYGIDAETLAKVQERIAQQEGVEPAAQTQADLRFEEGVTAFEAARYADAVTAFAAAMDLSPEDPILPFAYAQALFANRDYPKAAEVLRAALLKATPEEQGVFYPRGLYANDDALFEQIEQLLDKVETYGFDADLQLLLGYHLLGVGETEYARGPLEQAGRDLRNTQAAAVLLDLLKKMETTPSEPSDEAPQVRLDDVQESAAAPPAAVTEGAAKAEVLKRMEASSPDAADGTAQVKVSVPVAEVNTPPAKKEDDDN